MPPATSRPYRGVPANVRRADRRRRLVEAGLQLFGTQGFSATTIDAVCAEARLTKRYFYESFDSSESLLLAVYAEVNERVGTAVTDAVLTSTDQRPSAVAPAAIAGFLSQLHGDPRLARILLQEVFGVSERVDRAYQASIESWLIMIGGMMAGYEFPGVRLELLAGTLWGIVTGAALQWFLAGFTDPLDEVMGAVQAVSATVLASLRPIAPAMLGRRGSSLGPRRR